MSVDTDEQVASLDVESLLSEATGQVCVYDIRERSEYIDSLRGMLPDFNFISQTLPVGDYIVNGIIIERKTVDDLLQSINDGRLNNQLFEMSKNTHLSVLVIIGDQTKVRRDLQRSSSRKGYAKDLIKKGLSTQYRNEMNNTPLNPRCHHICTQTICISP